MVPKNEQEQRNICLHTAFGSWGPMLKAMHKRQSSHALQDKRDEEGCVTCGRRILRNHICASVHVLRILHKMQPFPLLSYVEYIQEKRCRFLDFVCLVFIAHILLTPVCLFSWCYYKRSNWSINQGFSLQLLKGFQYIFIPKRFKLD